MGKEESNKNSSPQNLIAILVIVLSIALILLFGIPAIISASGPPNEKMKDLLSMILPLVGAWMGTVLAYYFSKQNFEAANKQVNAMVEHVLSQDEKLSKTKVSEMMIDKEKSLLFVAIKDENEFRSLELFDVLKEFDKHNTERLVYIEKEKSKFIFLLYRASIDRFIAEHWFKDREKNKYKDKTEKGNLNINTMFEDKDYYLIQKVRQAWANKKNYFISSDDSLYRVKQLMKDNAICQDVLVTKTGNPEEPVLGWITNEMVVKDIELFSNATIIH
ncbi:MAG: hypothetical protein ACLQQ4_16295 [Bacteroidia bacterium]